MIANDHMYVDHTTDIIEYNDNENNIYAKKMKPEYEHETHR